MSKTEQKGELFTRCLKLRKTTCVHAPEEDEQGKITQKVHGAYRYPFREEIEQALEDAKKDLSSMFDPTDKTYIITKEKFERWFGS